MKCFHGARRPRVLLVLGALCLALCIAGTVTDILRTKAVDPHHHDDEFAIHGHQTIWRVCVDHDGHSQSCTDYDNTPDCLMDRVKVWRAFAISSILLSAIVILFGVVDLQDKLTPTRHRFMLLAIALLWCCTLVFWAVFADYFAQGCGTGAGQVVAPAKIDDHDSGADADWGPSPVLFIISWLLATAMLVVSLLTRRDLGAPEEIHILA